jgi:uncharacterized membrane protein
MKIQVVEAPSRRKLTLTGCFGKRNEGAVKNEANYFPRCDGRFSKLKIDRPGGKVGVALAKLFGADPRQQIREDLRRFNQMMETGEIPTTAG